MSGALNRDESKRLGELERVIERGLKSFMEVGTALMEIRDSRLYRSSHGTFNEYCHERWDISRERAHQLISSVDVVNSLSTTVNKPDSERVARPLSQLAERERDAAWEAAVESALDGKPTAAQVQEAVNEHRARINGEYAAEPRSQPVMQGTVKRPPAMPIVLEPGDVAPAHTEQIFVPNDPRQAADELRRYFTGQRLKALIMYLKG